MRCQLSSFTRSRPLVGAVSSSFFPCLVLRSCLIELATGHGGRYVGGGWGVQDNDVIINNYNINEYVGGGDWQDVSTDFDYSAHSGADFGGDF